MVAWTFSDVRAHGCLRMYARRLQVLGVHVDVSDRRVCAHARMRGCVHYGAVETFARECIHGAGWTRARVDAYTTRSGLLHTGVHYGVVETFARGCVYGLVATHVQIAHGLNFMDDCVIWPNYTDNRMQPKAKAMQLKVKGMHLKMEACN